MAKLCYKINDGIKKYDLKDTANKPRLAVRVGTTTKYLKLAEGTKSGELHVAKNVLSGDRIVTEPFHVLTWDEGVVLNWRDLSDPLKGTLHSYSSDKGGAQLWALCREDGFPYVIFGMLAADEDGDDNAARWDIREDPHFEDIDRDAAYDYIQQEGFIRIATGTFAHGASGSNYPPTPSEVVKYLTDKNHESQSGNTSGSFGYDTLNLRYVSGNESTITKKVIVPSVYSDHYVIRACNNAVKDANLSMNGINDVGSSIPYCKRCFYMEIGKLVSVNTAYRLSPNEVFAAFKTLNESLGTWNSHANYLYGRNY